MPRRGRYFLPEQPLHVIQRGNDRQAIFFGAHDYVRYRDWLQEAAYRPLFEQALDEDLVAEVRAATQGGWAIGGERFKAEIAARLRRRVTPLPPGRPANRTAKGGQLDLL